MPVTSIIPESDNTATLGDDSKRWADVKTVLLNGKVPAYLDVKQLTSDQSVSSNSLADITALSGWNLKAGKTYLFRAFLIVTTNSGTDGINISAKASVAPTSIRFLRLLPSSATDFTADEQTTNDGGSATTNGPGSTLRGAEIEGIIEAASDCTFGLRVASENNTIASTVKAGSIAWVQPIG